MSPSPTLHLTSAAEQDLADAIDWYDEQHPGLGNEFLLSVDDIFQYSPQSRTISGDVS